MKPATESPRRSVASRARLAAALAVAAYCAVGASYALADTWTWNGGGVPNVDWSDAANWTHTSGSSSSATPLSSQDTIVDFGGTKNIAPTQDIASPMVLNGLGFNSDVGGNGFGLQGSGLNFTTSSTSIAPSIVQNASSAILTIMEGVELTNNTTISGSGNGTLYFYDAISGAGALTISDAGIVEMPATTTNGTTINSGEVDVIDTNPFGTGTVNFNNGTIVALANLSITNSFNDITSSAVSFEAAPTKTLTFDPSNALLQSMNFGSATNNGTVIFGPIANGSSPGGTINVNGGTLLDGGAMANFLYRYTVSIAQGATVNLNGTSMSINNLVGAGTLMTGTATFENFVLASANFSGTITGSGTLSTGGTVILSGSNTFTGGSFFDGGTVGAGNASALGTGTVTVTANTALYAAGTSEVLANLISLNANESLTVQDDPNGANLLVLSGVISGPGELMKSGSGSLRLGANNTYTGGTILNSGEIQIYGNNSLGTGNLTLNGGTITANANATINDNYTTASATAPITFQAVSGRTLTLGGIATLGSETLNFGSVGNNGIVNFSPTGGSFTGGTMNVNAGTLLNGGALAEILYAMNVSIASSATLDLNNASTTFGNLTGAGTLTTGTTAGETFTLTAANFSGTITGVGALVTTGSTVILSGANTYSGGSTFGGGIVGAGSATALSTGPVTVTANTSLYAAGANETLANPFAINSSKSLTVQDDPNGAQDLTLSAIISGAGSLAKSGTGTLTLTGANTYTGGTILNAGTLQIASNSALSTGPITINGGGIRSDLANRTLTNLLTLHGSFTLGRSTTFTGNATLTSNITVSLDNPDAPANSDSSLSNISGAYSLTVSNGPLYGAGTGFLDLDGSNPFTGALTVNTNVRIGSGASNDSAIVGNIVINTGGTLQYAKSNIVKNTSQLTINTGGTLDLNNFVDAVATLSGAGSVINFGSMTLDLGSNATFSGNISGTGSLILRGNNGAGTETLSGTNTYAGATSIASGCTLIIAATGALPAGSPVTNNGNLTINANTTAGQLSGIGALTLGAAAALTLAPSSGTSEQAALTLNTASQLSLSNNAMIIEAPDAATKAADIAQLTAEVATARNGGTWNGPGITSTTVAASPTTLSLAIIDNGSLATPFTIFGGLPANTNSILIAPELLGDTNIDGTVDLDDLNTVLNYLGTAQSAWTNGNFDGAAVIDLNDLNDVLNNLGVSYANASTGLRMTEGQPAPTPEPASFAIIAWVVLPGLLRRRRKMRR